MTGLSGHDAAAIVYLGVIQIGIAYWLFSKGLRALPALEVSLLVLLEPVLNPLWTWLVHGERPSLLASAGGGIMVVALAARRSSSARAGRSPRPRTETGRDSTQSEIDPRRKSERPRRAFISTG